MGGPGSGRRPSQKTAVAQKFPCKYCKAAAGLPCRTTNSSTPGRATDIHASRVLLAEQAGLR